MTATTHDSSRRLRSITAHVAKALAEAAWPTPDMDARAEHLLDDLTASPEKYISPNPGVPFNEDWTNAYEGLKHEFGLRGSHEQAGYLRRMDDAAQAYYDNQIRGEDA